MSTKFSLRVAEIITTCFRMGLVFSGRTSRSEFWVFFFFCAVATAALFGLLTAPIMEPQVNRDFPNEALSWLALAMPFRFGLLWQIPILGLLHAFVLVPLLAAGWRRLYDADHRGWYIFVPWVALAIGRYSFVVGWFFADAFPSGSLAAILAPLLLHLGMGAEMAAAIGWLALIYLLSRPSASIESR